MEGVKRITVFLNDACIGTIRAPKSFSDLRKLLEIKTIIQPTISSYKVSTIDNDYGRIFNQKSYEE